MRKCCKIRTGDRCGSRRGRPAALPEKITNRPPREYPREILKAPPIRQTRVDSLESYFRTVRRGNFDRPKKAGRGSRFSAFCGATAAALPGSLPACRSPVLREIPHILHLRKHPFQTFKDRRERRRGPLGFLRSRIPSFSIIPPGGLLGNVGILNVEKC